MTNLDCLHSRSHIPAAFAVVATGAVAADIGAVTIITAVATASATSTAATAVS